jgi:PEP-CTERM motif
VVAAGGGAEWAVFNYQTTSPTLPLSTAGRDWSIEQIGIPAAVPLNFIADYAQWQGPNGANIPQTGGIFGQPLMANPVPGMTGSGEGSSGFVNPVGSGPLGSLGAFADPFNIVLNGLPASQVNGFTQALEFAPATAAVPEPSTWAMMFLGFAGLGFLGYRQTPKARLAAWGSTQDEKGRLRAAFSIQRAIAASPRPQTRPTRPRQAMMSGVS